MHRSFCTESIHMIGLYEIVSFPAEKEAMRCANFAYEA